MNIEVGSYQAKRKLPELLRGIQAGHRNTITLRGEAIANREEFRLPSPEARTQARDESRRPGREAGTQARDGIFILKPGRRVSRVLAVG